jgi:hypothetical protein
MKKIVAVCGDSWFSADSQLPGKSFGEVMCIANDWELLSLARGGCSNFAIRLQVDKAIELGVDAVVLGTTSPDRSEFPIITDQNRSIWEKLKNSFNWKDWFTSQPEVYVKSRGISNILHTNSVSSTHKWISDPTIISESLNNLMFVDNKLFVDNKKLTAEQLDSLRYYMLNLYDSGIKRQIDSWIISDACRKLEQFGIPYIIFIESLYQWDFSQDISWVPEKNVVRPKDFSVWKDLPRDSTLFHYDPIQGSKIFANYVESRIKDLL